MKILVVTETDACCGPMAAAFLRDYSLSLEVVSAGMNPLESFDPMVVTVMKECLIDLSDYQPKKVSDFNPSAFDVVYECPERPCQKTIEAYRELRDFIKNDAYLFFRSL
jgi:protein-tyrosine-phosphatase